MAVRDTASVLIRESGLKCFSLLPPPSLGSPLSRAEPGVERGSPLEATTAAQGSRNLGDRGLVGQIDRANFGGFDSLSHDR
jgi:hypothetical protein